MPTQPNAIDPAKLSVTNELVQQLNRLLMSLLTASRATANGVELMQINNEMLGIQAVLNTAVQCQAASDDALFSQAVGNLKTQAGILSDMEAQVQAVVSDVASVGRIIGYIGQALTLIARL